MGTEDAGAAGRRPETAGAAGGGEHLAYVAHEVRNRLATALWSTELLGRLAPSERGGDRGAQLAKRAHRALERLGRLVEDHLLVARLAAGSLGLDIREVPLREALGEASARAGAAGRGFPDVAALSLRADRALLVRALEALLARAGRDGAEVRVGAEAEGGAAVVNVAGAEVSSGDLALPQRGSPSEPEGRSLGLVVAGEVARAHGGALCLDGAALRLSWPLARG